MERVRFVGRHAVGGCLFEYAAVAALAARVLFDLPIMAAA
jgi:hypothetical protein